jgi:hypothetical protein
MRQLASKKSKKQKLYCYVDETGQDTKGEWFLVAVIVLADKKEKVEKNLLEFEHQSGKHKTKWHKAKHRQRQSYLDKIISDKELKNCFYYSAYKNTILYADLVALTTAKAILDKAEENYSASIVVDGLRPNLENGFAVSLRKLKIKTSKVKGARDENSPLIRLADSIAGLARDALENKEWAKKYFAMFVRKGFAHEI